MKKLLYLTALLTSVSYGAFRSDYITATSSMTTPIVSVTTGNVTYVYSASATATNLSVGPSSASINIPGVYNSIDDPTGFTNRSSTITFNNSNLTLSITPHTIFIKGVRSNKGTATKAISNTTGVHVVYYDSNGVIQESTVFPGFNVPLIGTVYWNSSLGAGLLGDERHGIQMDAGTHEFLHDTIGARYESGLTGSFDIQGGTVTAGEIHDEDIEHSISEQKKFLVLYKDGSADYAWGSATSTYYLMNGSNMRYNNGNNLADAGSNAYVAQWIFVTNNISTPIVSIIGQRTDTTIANARANNTYESLSLGTLPFNEMKLIYRVILRNTSPVSYIESSDYRSVSGVPSGTFVATAHNVLTGLNWATAGHTFDTDLALGSYGLTGASATVTYVGASTGVFTSSITASGVRASTMANVSIIEFKDGTTQTSAPSGGATKFVSVIDPASVRLSSDSCVISNSTNALTASLLCDDASEEFVFFATELKPYTATSLSLDLNYSMVSATSGDVTFWGEMMCVSPEDAADVDTESFATRVSSSVAVAGTAGYLRKAKINLTDDTCASGDVLILKFGRAGQLASDSAAGDTEIRPSVIYEP